MKRKIAFIAAFLLYISSLVAQDVKIGLQTGYGFYNMTTLSSLTNDILQQLPFDAKIISNYPPYIYYQPRVIFSSNNLEYGFSYTFLTTGSRISSKDYSGEYKFDTSIDGNCLGFILGSKSNTFERFNFGYSLTMGVNFTTFKVMEILKIDTSENSSDDNFSGTSLYIEPSINFTYAANKHFNIGADLTYSKDLYKLSSYEIPVKDNFYEVDMWDGFRMGITLSYIIFK